MSGPWEKSIAQRAPLATADTDALRLIDGAGDGLPGITLEAFARHWLLSTPTPNIPAPILTWLRSQPRSIYHKHLSQQQKDSPTHLHGPPVSEPFLIQENGIKIEISFHSGYSQGIFLDQRLNRLHVRQRAAAGSATILNTFAYTGAFSVAAALGGATTTTLDLSQPYLNWAKRNFTHNQLDPAAHHFCKGDTIHWLTRFRKQGRKFHGIILDPPTFSRDENGKVFRVEKDFGQLAALAHSCLEKNGWLLCSTNCHHLTRRDFEAQLRSALPKSAHLHHNPMPPDFTDAPYLKNVWVDF